MDTKTANTTDKTNMETVVVKAEAIGGSSTTTGIGRTEATKEGTGRVEVIIASGVIISGISGRTIITRETEKTEEMAIQIDPNKKSSIRT